MFGSGSSCWYGPEFWMVHDIIVVTFNYRLGPLGKKQLVFVMSPILLLIYHLWLTQINKIDIKSGLYFVPARYCKWKRYIRG